MYANDNRGRLPLAVEDMGLARLNPNYITEEMYVNFGFPALLDSSGNANGTPIANTWQCPGAISSVGAPGSVAAVFNWAPYPTRAGNNYPAHTITRYDNVIETSYAYCGNGLGFTQPWATAANQYYADASFVRDTLPVRVNDTPVAPLFCDKVEWHYTAGFFANHGTLLTQPGTYGDPQTPGMNEVFNDGHGEWVDLRSVPLLNGGQANLGLPIFASVPVILYPQALPLPKGYPAVMHRGQYPFYEFWYW